MNGNKKPLSEKMLLDFLRKLKGGFPPVRLSVIEAEKRAREPARTIDAIAEVAWNEKRFIFAVAAKLQFSPKAIQAAAQQITASAEQLSMNPMIVAPYLAEDQLRDLESSQVSGIDLCGNGVIIVPEQLLVFRTGNPNRYPSSSPIQNVYRGTSSIVARMFLIRPYFESAQEMRDAIRDRGGEVTLSTISKVCSSLADDLIIERVRKGRTTRLRLLQPDKLLGRLVANYTMPKPRAQIAGKLNTSEDDLQEHLENWMTETGGRIIRTGTASCDRYATMAREPIARYYCTDITGLVTRLDKCFRTTDRFADIELFEVDDANVYFDPRDGVNASPLQAYLELAKGDKREQDTAAQVGQRILGDVSRLLEKICLPSTH